MMRRSILRRAGAVAAIAVTLWIISIEKKTALILP